MHIIISNGGNDSVALIQWAIQARLPQTYVVVVQTGWSAPHWKARTDQLLAWAGQHALTPIELTPPQQFQDLVRARGTFPSQKFQWCAGLLKGLPLLTWLDEIDPHYRATILIGHRRDSSSANFHLPERLEVSERYGDRAVWHPLVQETREQVQHRVAQTPLPWIHTRALECDPCIHCPAHDLKNIAPENVAQTTALEQALEQPMFEQDIYQGARTLAEFQQQQGIETVVSPSADLTMMDMGCGSPYGCGT